MEQFKLFKLRLISSKSRNRTHTHQVNSPTKHTPPYEKFFFRVAFYQRFLYATITIVDDECDTMLRHRIYCMYNIERQIMWADFLFSEIELKQYLIQFHGV